MRSSNKIIAKLSLLSLISFAMLSAFAQEKPDAKLKIFQKEVGVVVVTSTSKVGTETLGSKNLGKFESGSVDVECIELIDPSSKKEICGIQITLNEMKPIEVDTSYVDYDELGSLIKGIDYIAKKDKSIVKLDTFRAEYYTKGRLSISCSDGDDKTSCVVASGDARLLCSMDDLEKFKSLLEKAKVKLDSIQGTNNSQINKP